MQPQLDDSSSRARAAALRLYSVRLREFDQPADAMPCAPERTWIIGVGPMSLADVILRLDRARAAELLDPEVAR